MAATAHRAGCARLPWPHRILSKIHPIVWRHCGSPHAAAQEGSFCWTPAAAVAFDALKAALTSALVLQLPDFTKMFTMDCDTSGSGFGVVLHQGNGLIAFFSHAISPHHAKLAAYERELIGLVKAVRHWRPYLWTWPFVVRTDHYSLKYLLDQRLSTIPQLVSLGSRFPAGNRRQV
jgi:hypothetical protein